MIIEINDPYPYDTMFKRSMEVKEIARDFIEQVIPIEIQKYLDLDSLKLEKNDFVDNTIGQGFVDVIFSAKMKRKLTYINVLIESQSKPDRFMPTRIHKYKSLIYEAHRKKYPKSKYVPSVIPIVFYTCKRIPGMPRTVSDLTEYPKFDKLIQSFGIIEHYLPEIPDEKIMKKENTTPMMILTKYAKYEDFMNIIKKIDEPLKNISENNKLYFQDCLIYTMRIADYEKKKKVMEHFKNLASSTEQKEEVMNIAQGIFLEGEMKAKVKIAKSLLSMKQELGFISRATGLSIEELRKLQSEM